MSHLPSSAPAVTVTLTPRRAGLRVGHDEVVDVLVRLQAPDAPADHVAARPPQAIALVIDRSGSMKGRPIEEAKRCAAFVVDQLRPTDSVSLVQFDHRVKRLWPAVPRGDGAVLKAAIAEILPGGHTDLHGGWREGASTLEALGGPGLRRVILLSDGQANQGLTDDATIADQCAAWAAGGVSTSTCGLGHRFNEDLMMAMARAGGGNAYYGDTADDLMDPFRQELELLGHLYRRDVRLTALVGDGVEVQMLNALPAVDGGWRLPDLAWGAEAWAVLRLKVAIGRAMPLGDLRSLLQVTVQARGLEGDAAPVERAGLALPVLSPEAFDALIGEDELVTRRLVELDAADALSRMRAAARHADWNDVDRLLEDARQRFSGNEWVAAVLQAMEAIARSRSRERLMKESMYASAKLRSRLVAKGEDGKFAAGSGADGIPAYLRRKAAQGKGDLPA
jgi:Ca-activated chloride channel family protein